MRNIEPIFLEIKNYIAYTPAEIRTRSSIMEVSARSSDARSAAESRGGAAPDAFLTRLGDRVRAARARRGMSRRILSRASSVSERYLAQLEAGKGNISIALLRKVAEAMSVPVADLVREGAERPVDLTLLIRKLERLDPDALTQANRLLTETLGLGKRADRVDRIALTGLRGAGKSTLGAALAARQDVPFIEMAGEIERTAGMPVDQIFDLSGQAAYRRYERRALEDVLAVHPQCVIATGGSIVSEPETYELLLDECFTVWLQALPEDHMRRVRNQGDTRPMENSGEAMADLERILETRKALYARADVALDTSNRSAEAALNVLGLALNDARRKNE